MAAMLPFRARSNKGQQDQEMDKLLLAQFPIRQCHGVVSATFYDGFQNAPVSKGFCTIAGADKLSSRSYTTKIADFIQTFPARYLAPLFLHISHPYGSVVLRNLRQRGANLPPTAG